MGELVKILMETDKMADLRRAATDIKYREKLYQQYKL